ncbi:MAG: DUF4332 domain-containing protein [Cellvibrionales bacterium]|nr:DUF4332 domain-containing protein [Cellvibrionales bacterium]
MTKLVDIEGLSARHAKQLQQAGVRSAESLLKKAGSKKGRQDVSKSCQLSEKQLLEWVNRADLTRIKGISTQFSDLLENSGVDSVPELANRKADNLYAKLHEVNKKKHFVKRLPSEKEVAHWVSEAKRLPKMVTH